ncbi:probable ubiquitin conjugation factor E4 [Cryptomeria japonica]|uniref:probable ubiquitin conjugation factor E4 n=1 Tax=Cryptomeria japonica TaxID=3369 RepID=UPI0027DAB48E|nr:probable ubiquitin conjugation factor E4 [Cryptomeria japonica]XP_057872483.2 probable ubiquitin conjugation factor E4 [Cryptomeria japonica]
MAQAKPNRSPAEVEDIILRRIFQVTLESGRDHVPSPVYLEQTAAEVLSEGRPLLLSMDIMERILIDRLSIPNLEPPLKYLVQCYRRAQEEIRKIPSMRDKSLSVKMEEMAKQARQLAVSYSRIVLGNPDMFPQSALEKSYLLDLFMSGVSSSYDTFGESSASGITVPLGFLEDFLRDFEEESLDPILKQLYDDLKLAMRKVASPLQSCQVPLAVLKHLIEIPVCVKALVNHPSWIPKGDHVDGRFIEIESILGPFFHVSALPDHVIFTREEQDVGQQCFSNADTRRPADLSSSFTTIKTVMNQIYEGLHFVLYALLKNSNTREKVLEYLAEVIKKNAARAQINVNPFKCASSGMFVSLSAVMLKLCEPFLGDSTKMNLIDANYVLCNGRIDCRGLTAIHASSEEIATWVDRRNYARTEGYRQLQHQKEQEERRVLQTQGATSSGSLQSFNSVGVNTIPRSASDGRLTKYSFVTECFFMTARILNLGLLKVVSDFQSLLQDLRRCQDALETLEAQHGPGAPPQLEQEINNAKLEIEHLSQQRFCYDAQICKDIELLQQALSFYRLMLVWLVNIVGGFRMPLPAECPMEFASMPEHFVDDGIELLLFTSRLPKALDGVVLDDFMNFIIMFMASPLYIKNPYLRAKMVNVLNAWMPEKSKSSAMSTLFEGHPLALEYLVFNLMKLYVDIEFTGSHTQFYDKFNIRHHIAELLEYLWQVPSHRNAWKGIARSQEKGMYLNFLNFLINDSIFLLDESFNMISELKKMEAEMNTVEWEQRTPQERQERTRHFHQQEQYVRWDMTLANEDVGMLAYTSAEITSPFLLPEMVERVANMLNYFLSQLVGPQRKTLTLRDPEKYEFRPKKLLKQIAEIYVHLSRGDKDNVFPSAVSSDGRSYKDQLFSEAAELLRRIGEDGRIIQEFVDLSAKARAAASEAMDTESMLGDIPDDFLDPIQFTLMRDPVILPSSRTTVDRPTIQRHLLSDATDPFNRSLLTPEMLIPNTELKNKIEEFIRSKSRI